MKNNYSACQNKTAGCGACCGIYNLVLGVDERKTLLQKRTSHFANVNLKQNESIVAYRQDREESEKTIKRYDHEIYACPFLGYIEKNRPGCLAHPSLTKDERTQNFSFYSASICQTYECTVKETDSKLEYSQLINKHFDDSDVYGRLYPDYLFYSYFFHKKGLLAFLLQADKDSKVSQAFYKLCSYRLLTKKSVSMTSFEISHTTDYTNLNNLLELLMETFVSKASNSQKDHAVLIRKSIDDIFCNCDNKKYHQI